MERKGVDAGAQPSPPEVFESGGGRVDLMFELLSCFRSLPSNAPFVAFGVDGGR